MFAGRHALQPPELERILKFNFGLPSFRSKQLEAITATLEGHDSLVILPTGAGKSLIFQFPPFVKEHSFTVVVSPLIALAKDQVEKCEERGIYAERWNCEVADSRKSSIASELASEDPSIRLLYTTPESLRLPKLRDSLKEACENGTLCSFAIDEAHCVSEWGHDFRPAYLELVSLKQDFPTVPIAALTASCTSKVEASVLSVLKLKDARVIKASFNRHNIAYQIRHKELIGDGSDGAAIEDLVEFIKARPDECGIIYARLRSTCDWLTQTLSGYDLDVGCYHAGRGADQRNRVQRDWSDGGTNIVVATIAFGMGIDRADVRWVVHWNAPSSMEGFYQESGRAGRDGLPSLSVLYSSRADLESNQKMEKGVRSGSVQQVAEFALGGGCRRKAVLKYFGEARGSCDCAAEQPCDWCMNPQAVQRQLGELEIKAMQASRAASVRAQMLGPSASRQGSVADGDKSLGTTDGGDDEQPGPSKPKLPGWNKASTTYQQQQQPAEEGCPDTQAPPAASSERPQPAGTSAQQVHALLAADGSAQHAGPPRWAAPPRAPLLKPAIKRPAGPAAAPSTSRTMPLDDAGSRKAPTPMDGISDSAAGCASSRSTAVPTCSSRPGANHEDSADGDHDEAAARAAANASSSGILVPALKRPNSGHAAGAAFKLPRTVARTPADAGATAAATATDTDAGGPAAPAQGGGVDVALGDGDARGLADGIGPAHAVQAVRPAVGGRMGIKGRGFRPPLRTVPP